MHRREIEAAAEEYLSSRNYIIWAEWDLTKPSNRAKAVEWLVTQVEEVQATAKKMSRKTKAPTRLKA